MSNGLANAIIAGNQPLVTQLLADGEDCNAMDEYGYKPLIEAAIANNTAMAKLLLEHGANVNEPDVTGGTALHWAAENNNLDLCQLLLNAGADPNAYNRSGQPVLVKPYLRKQTELKNFLIKHGADLTFAQDFINVKLIGHRFELSGRVDIVDASGKFIEVDYEGFILEFTVNLIQQSLSYYINNFAARDVRQEMLLLKKIDQSLAAAAELIKYQQYLVNAKHHQKMIDHLLRQDLLVLPIGYAGHAIALIKYKNLLIRCDRGEMSHKEYSVVIYKIGNLAQANHEFFQFLLYQKHDADFIQRQLKSILGLEYIDRLPIESQVAGNCSWANLEAVIPASLYLLKLTSQSQSDSIKIKEQALNVYKKWLSWDKDWALDHFINDFAQASPARKASIAAILAAVLFQACEFTQPGDQRRANKIMTILSQPGYRYVLDSYIKIYRSDGSKMGHNLQQLLDLYLR